MKKTFNTLILSLIVSLALIGCSKEEYKYGGGEYVLFADSVATFGIDGGKTENIMDVTVGVTTTTSYDRNYAVEVIDKESNAIEGFHYDIISNNVTIKAGERTANVKLKGYYSNIQRNDSLVVTLGLVTPGETKWGLYGDKIKIDLMKCYPFNIDDFTGHIQMMATFPYSSDQYVTLYREAEKVDEHTIVLKNLFNNNSDVYLKFSHDDSTDDEITVKEQNAFMDASYGQVRLRSMDTYPSYYNSADKFYVLYLDMYIPSVGSFGVQQFIFKTLTDEEYELIKNGIIK